jgi:UDP-N-acetylmuramyl pentapeptide phosphotransferase/UDP-N-acetylglucosamine-1-phosphate transferase
VPAADVLGLSAIAIFSALASAALIAFSMPVLRRYAMARPNARSTHRTLTPQGAGAAVVLVAVLAAGLAMAAGGPRLPFHPTLCAAAMVMAVLGAIDDMRPLTPKSRLAVQALLVTTVLIAAPAEWRLAPALPLAAERIIAVIAGVWFVNLTNFMDGIDGLTVAEIAPVAAVLGLLAGWNAAYGASSVLAIALAGALIGFLVFNRPPAKVFLGDVGSLPIGLIIAALLFELAATVAVAPALILPMYYCYDATETLLKGLIKGDDVFAAHRRHAYQNAVDGGWTAGRVCRWVLVLNLVLIVLGVVALLAGPAGQALSLLVALAATVFVSRTFRGALRKRLAS